MLQKNNGNLGGHIKKQLAMLGPVDYIGIVCQGA